MTLSLTLHIGVILKILNFTDNMNDLHCLHLQTDFHEITLDLVIHRYFLKVSCLVENRLFCSTLQHCVCVCVCAVRLAELCTRFRFSGL